MGTGVCSRRQRRVFQCLLVLTVVCGLFYGGMVSYEMHQQLRRTEAMALKYQQHQESLSAQLQGKKSRDERVKSSRSRQHSHRSASGNQPHKKLVPSEFHQNQRCCLRRKIKACVHSY